MLPRHAARHKSLPPGPREGIVRDPDRSLPVDSARYVVALLLVIFLPPALLWWYLVHPFVDFWRGVGAGKTLAIMTVLALAGAAGLFTVRFEILGEDLGTNWLLVALGVLLAAGAVAIGLARRKHLTTRILSGLPQLEAGGKGGTLLTEGPYASVRHPRYIEVALGVLAYAFFSNYVGAYLVALLTLPALHGIVILEERELADRFGEEWRAYKARVPRYFPRRGGAEDPQAGAKSQSTTS